MLGLWLIIQHYTKTIFLLHGRTGVFEGRSKLSSINGTILKLFQTRFMFAVALLAGCEQRCPGATVLKDLGAWPESFKTRHSTDRERIRSTGSPASGAFYSEAFNKAQSHSDWSPNLTSHRRGADFLLFWSLFFPLLH